MKLILSAEISSVDLYDKTMVPLQTNTSSSVKTNGYK